METWCLPPGNDVWFQVVSQVISKVAWFRVAWQPQRSDKIVPKLPIPTCRPTFFALYMYLHKTCKHGPTNSEAIESRGHKLVSIIPRVNCQVLILCVHEVEEILSVFHTLRKLEIACNLCIVFRLLQVYVQLMVGALYH